MIAYDVGVPSGSAERDALARILAVSFNAPEDRIQANFEVVGNDALRVIRDGARVVGGLKLIDMGQWFGGRSVPMQGIAAVGIEPSWRGKGAGGTLMRSVMAELAAAGAPLSTLYPATVPVYRGAGFELAGSRWLIKLPLRGLPTKSDGPATRTGGPDDFAAMKAAYDLFAARHDGMLDRGDYIWQRARYPRGKTALHHVVGDGDAIEGYTSYTVEETSTGWSELHLTDLIANTPAACQRLLAFFGAHQSMNDTLHVATSPRHPMLLGQADWRPKAKLMLHWMTRVTNVPAALTARGYPSGLQTELHLDVTDDVVPANAGPCVLRVSGGRATVEPGGQGTLRLDVRGLAALYTGFQTPSDLSLQGLLAGPDEDMARAGAVFAGPDPWMPSIF